MAKLIVNIGSTANAKNGDPLRTAFDKINQNFTEIYTLDSAKISLASLKTVAAASTDFADFKTRIATL
jgi:hypothetical protein